MAWTDERKEIVKRLWADGFSASQIAGELSVTRNAIIGVVHRMGLPKRREKADPAKRRVPTQRRRPVRSDRPSFNFVSRNAFEPVEAEPVADVDIPPIEPKLTVLGLTDATCRWPVGDPQSPDFRFCGHVRNGDKPYCPAHCAMAYQAIIKSRRKRSDQHTIFCAEVAA